MPATSAARPAPVALALATALASTLAATACGPATSPAPPAEAPAPPPAEAPSTLSASGPSPTPAPGPTDGAGPTSPLQARLAPLLERLATPPLGPAASITAISGEATATLSSGTLHDGGPTATDGTRFSVASVSKVVTASRIVALAHEGALRLDDRLPRHLPGVRLVDPDGRDRTRDVTLRDLLTHRAGLPHLPPDLEAKVAGRWEAPRLLTELTDRWTIRLLAAPGTYRYANTGYALLAAILERRGDCSFADCMQPHLAALGMERSTFWPGALHGDAAHGHVRRDGAVQVHVPGWYGSRYALPFNGLWTTTPDLARFGARLAEAASDPESPLHAMTVGEGHAAGPVISRRLGARSIEHDGSNAGFHAALVVVPERKVVVAITTNGGAETRAEAEAFAAIVADVVTAAAPPPDAPSP